MFSSLASIDAENNHVSVLNQIHKKGKAHRLGYDPSKSQVYDSSYVLLVLQIMDKIGLGPIQVLMQTEAKLMDVTAQIQSDLTTVQDYISRIQNDSYSSGCYQHGAVFNPNANNGISPTEFHESVDAVQPQSVIDGKPNPYYHESTDMHNATVDFLSAFKEIFVPQPIDDPDQVNPDNAVNYQEFTVHKTDKQGNIITQTIPLRSIYERLNGSGEWGQLDGRRYFAYGQPKGSGQYSASLLQKYVYYSYKLAAEQATGEVSISRLGISFAPSDVNFDGVAKSLFSFANSFNTCVVTARQNGGADMNGLITPESGNILGWIYGSNPFLLWHDTKTGLYGPNILGCFSYLAFNYFWTKNPNASMDGNAYRGAVPLGGGWTYQTFKGIPKGDQLSEMYSKTQGTASVIGNNSNTGSNEEQKYTSEVSSYQNIGLNIVQSDHKGNKNMISNFRS